MLPIANTGEKEKNTYALPICTTSPLASLFFLIGSSFQPVGPTSAFPGLGS